MNGAQMSHFLSMDHYTGRCFEGFAMRNSRSLPGNKRNNPALYILNTDVNSGPGEHWCVAYYRDGVLEFFDSFGFHPTFYQFDQLLSSRKFSDYTFNPHMLQHFSSKFCGHHCLFFAYHRCRGLAFEEVLNLYDLNNPTKNDRMVLDFTLQFGNGYKPSF